VEVSVNRPGAQGFLGPNSGRNNPLNICSQMECVMSNLIVNHIGATVSEDRKVLGIAVYSEREMMVVGSSIPMSVPPFARDVSSFYLRRVDGEDLGVVALSLKYHKGMGRNRTVEEISGFLPVYWDKDKPVDRDNPIWLPRHDRLGQVNSNGVEVRTDNRLYTSHLYRMPAEHDQERFSVEDTNLLCRYLVGLVEEDALKAAIGQKILDSHYAERHREISLKCEGLERENRSLRSQLRPLANARSWEQFWKSAYRRAEQAALGRRRGEKFGLRRRLHALFHEVEQGEQRLAEDLAEE